MHVPFSPESEFRLEFRPFAELLQDGESQELPQKCVMTFVSRVEDDFLVSGVLD